jgi:hypothetical protein
MVKSIKAEDRNSEENGTSFEDRCNERRPSSERRLLILRAFKKTLSSSYKILEGSGWIVVLDRLGED